MKKIAFLFAGQGAQAVGMGHDIYEKSQAAKSLFDMGEALRPGTKALCFEGPGDELTLTENTQPCLFLTDLAFALALKEQGIKADAVAGFSLGEIPALAFAGILSNEDAYKLVMLRGKAMSDCAKEHPGAMAAVLKLENEKIEAVCSEFNEMWAVNYNCPGQLACAGSTEEIDEFCARIKAEGGRAVKLSVSGAFHTPYLSGVTDILANAMEEMEVSAPEIPIYANLTAEKYPDYKEGIIGNVSGQVSNSVKWETLIRRLSEKEGITTFVEVGPGKTLTGLVKRILPEAEAMAVNDAISLEEAVKALKN